MMQSQIRAVILFILSTLAVISCSTSAITTPTICDPAVLEQMPSHIRKVCLALENSNQLSTALNAYIRNEASSLFYRGEDLATSNGADKRTDVDHVFLRFGRRR